jgi:N,N'-diacetyllegionaminate synthase
LFSIDGKAIGGGRTFVIAEVAQAHEGKIDLAHQFIDRAAEAGADAVKFQTHIAEAESSFDEPFRIPGNWPAPTRFDYWKLMEFGEADWQALAAHARERGLSLLSSPFSIEAADLLRRVGVPAWKVASGELMHTALLEHMAATGLPMILSTGLASDADIDEAVGVCAKHRLPYAVLQTASVYPCPPERVGLNLMTELGVRYRCPAGLSDHSGTIYPGLAAVTLGAAILEVHLTLDRQMTGPDMTSSLTPSELRTLVEGARFIETMRANPVSREASAEAATSMRGLFTRSLAFRRDLPAGTVVSSEHLSLRKPGTGIAPAEQPAVEGRRLVRAVRAHTLVRAEDLE